MSYKKPTYSAEFRTKMVELANSGSSLCGLARKYGCSHEAIRKWLKQAELNAGNRTDGLTSSEQAAFRKSRGENRLLREKNFILRRCLSQLYPDGFAKEVGGFKFVSAHQDDFKVKNICRTLGLSKSGFYAWQKREEAKRKLTDGEKAPQFTEETIKEPGDFPTLSGYQEQLDEKSLQASGKRVYRLIVDMS